MMYDITDTSVPNKPQQFEELEALGDSINIVSHPMVKFWRPISSEEFCSVITDKFEAVRDSEATDVSGSVIMRFDPKNKSEMPLDEQSLKGGNLEAFLSKNWQDAQLVFATINSVLSFDDYKPLAGESLDLSDHIFVDRRSFLSRRTVVGVTKGLF